MSQEELFARIYVDADLTPRIVSALRQRGYECRSALEDTVGELEPSLSRSEFTGYASDNFPLGIRPERGLLRLAR
jgi:hypothetical protein